MKITKMVIMEVILQLRPNDIEVIDHYDLDLTEEEEDLEEEDPIKVPQFAFIPKSILGEIGATSNAHDISSILQHIKAISFDTSIPRFHLNLDDIGIVQNIDGIYANLDLTINYRTILNRRSQRSFEKDFISREVGLKRFKTAIIHRDGYFHEESNYFYVDESNFNAGTKCTMLRNNRIILYWRNVILPNETVKRILTAGLLVLAGKLTQTELVSLVRDGLPSGQFEVSVNHNPNSYVLIGIEAPVFRY
jgi:hypothetical protein